MTEASLLENCQQEQRHFRNSDNLAFERLKRLLERKTSLPSLVFGRAYPITCKFVNLAHVVGSVDLLRGQAFGCGLARPRNLVGESPTQVTVSHGPGIKPCSQPGNRLIDA